MCAFDEKLRPETVLFTAGDRGIEPAWKTDALFPVLGTPVIVDGDVYLAVTAGRAGGRADASLQCLDLATGKPLWPPQLTVRGSSPSLSLVAADGKLVVLDNKGMLRIAQPTADGLTQISSCDLYNGESTLRKFWTAPVLCNARIYCRNFAGDLICVDVSR